MLKFQWNALRKGDRVFVHEASESDLALRAGVVTLVDVRSFGHDVGICLGAGTPGALVVRPGRFAVHLDPIDPSDECWRCSDN